MTFVLKRPRRPWECKPMPYVTAAEESRVDQQQAAVVWARGEDRSNFQPVGPWTADDFGMCKATEATSFIDPTFAANWRNLKAEGKPRFAYHFLHPSISPIDQAHFFFNTVQPLGLDPGDGLVVDSELASGTNGEWFAAPDAWRRSNLPGELRAAPPPLHAGVADSATRLFGDTVTALAGPHCPFLVYTDLSVGVTLTSCTRFGLFIAYYASAPPPSVAPWSDWLFWQNQAGGGEGGGDRDQFHGPKNQLLSWRQRFIGTPPPPPSKATYVTGEDNMFQVPATGETIMPLIPVAVPQPDGSLGAPTAFRLATPSAVAVQYMLSETGPWVNETIDGARSPNGPYPLDGATSLKVRLSLAQGQVGPIVTGDFV